jgi:hypothetical protein
MNLQQLLSDLRFTLDTQEKMVAKMNDREGDYFKGAAEAYKLCAVDLRVNIQQLEEILKGSEQHVS